MINFCTLFDSFYLDKAIALYRSFCRYSDNFHLYVFCFDDRSYEIVNKLDWKNATVLSEKNIETEELLELKKQRSKAEYCWTCTPVIIEYVLDTYEVNDCTYIDADMFFYGDPQCIFNEIVTSKADIAIMEHRFPKDRNYEKNVYKAGKYCVEFNYFNQTENSRKALTWWKERCREWCFYKNEPGRMGDQKYLEKFPVLFFNVHEIQNEGAGIAPWNFNQYELVPDAKEIILQNKKTGEKFELIFFHFQNLRYFSRSIVNIKSQTKDRRMKYRVYIPYLAELIKAEILLEQRYGLVLERKKKYSDKWFSSFLQKYVVVFKIGSLTDIISLKRIRWKLK